METLSIKNYKCLEDIEFSQLKNVNLITGKNNTGKSTILEALSLYAAKGDIFWIRQLLKNRGEINDYNNNFANVKDNINILSSFFEKRKVGFDNNDSIKITSDSDTLSIRFVRYVDEEITKKGENNEDEILTINRKILSSVIPEDASYGLEIKSNNFKIIHPLDRHLFRHIFSNTNQRDFHLINSKGDDIFDIASLWDKITLTDKEDFVINALKMVEPNISRLTFVGENSHLKSRYPIVKLNSSGNKYPLKAMGDGINRILNITLALVNSEGGFLFIDEFENGLHYSVQEELWKIIFTLSSKLNIQVFATTHSNDTINSFARILKNNKSFNGNLYRLERKNNKTKTFLFSKEEITEASKQKIDLR